MNEGKPTFETVNEPRELTQTEITAAQEPFNQPVVENEPISPEVTPEDAAEAINADQENIEAVKNRLASHVEAAVLAEEASPTAAALEAHALENQAQKLSDPVSLPKVAPAALAIGSLAAVVGGSSLGFAAAAEAGNVIGWLVGISFTAWSITGLGALGWLGLKTYQGLKQHAHRKKLQ